MAQFLLGVLATWLFCLPLTVAALALFLAAKGGDQPKDPEA